ncbi:Sea4p [Sporobolomyces koalae]|uniref:Sea4p n=1 Tax=Sporobolomyces koalae TaxID=500713 RepID=UPI00317CA196
MSANQRGKVVWSGNQCLVGGSAELRLYDYDDPTSTFHSLSVVTELPGLRTFAWYPHTDSPLVAAGLTTGRVLLVRLPHPSSSSPPSTSNVVQINVRHARPITATAFSPSHSGLLAVGLEKGRGESLLVYDINATARALDGTAPRSTPRGFSLHRETSQRGRAHSPAHSSTTTTTTTATGSSSTSASLDPHPLMSLGSSELINCAAFLSSSYGPSASSTSPLLVASMANKWIRVYDIRSPPSTVTSWGSRSVYGLGANPTNAQQFISHGDDGVVKLWDLRKPMEALLSFSEADAGAVPTVTRRSSAPVKPLAEINWDPTRRGIVATLEKDSSYVRLWNLVDGPGPKLVDSQFVTSNGELEASLSELTMEGRRPVWEEREEAAIHARQDILRMPIVIEDRRSQAFNQALSSFAFAPASSNLSPPIRIVGLSRETTGPGSTGHRLEMISLPHPPHFDFLERGIIASSSNSFSHLQSFQVMTEEPVHAHTHGLLPPPQSPRSAPLALDGTNTTIRGRGHTLASNSDAVDRNATPRPTAQLQRHPSTEAHVTDFANEEEGTADFDALAEDMSVLLRQRVVNGYGSDAHKNVNLCEASLAEFWRWIGRAQALSGNSCLNDYDFRYRGVLRILHGFPLSSGASGYSTPRGYPNPSSTNPERSSRPGSSRSHRRPDDSHLKTSAFDAACAQLVVRRKLEHVFAISSSSFKDQRKLALQVCGMEWELPVDVVCSDFEKSGDYEAAAKHAFFSGQLEKSMNYLRLCKDRELRMLAPILAAYLAQRNSSLGGGGSESTYAELCQSLSLSTDIDVPWVRALFAFLASGEWREVGNEMGLPLRDRVAVALRFLSDSELVSFLKELENESLSFGDLEAVLLFGLRNDGLTLLSNYIDRTSDVQTAALAYSFVSPGLIRNDLRVVRWIETYRAQLDQLRLWTDRAKFDTARGVRARAAMEQSRLAGKPSEANEVATMLRKIAPAQIVVRCGYCATNIGPQSAGGRNEYVHNRGHGSGVAGKSTLCPSCSKQLPACSICLTRPSIHSFEVNGSSMLAWCQRCRHGGHATHLLDWFERSQVCAVAGCDCRCRSEGGGR